MTLPSVFAEENPFIYIKARHIFICFFLGYCGLAIQFLSIYIATGHDYHTSPDAIFGILLGEIAFALTIAWIVRQLKFVQIKPGQIIGKLPRDYRWLPIIGIVIARIVFSVGSFRVLYYPLSFIFPSWVEHLVVNNFIVTGSESFSPALYYLFYTINGLIVSPIAGTFIFQGIILHRWSAKWGIRPAILIFSLVYSMPNFSNLLGYFSVALMLNLLYIKSKTLIVPIVTCIINNAIIFLLSILYLYSENSLDQFRSHLGIGVFCVAVSTPLLIWVLYKNRIRPNEQLPYFANANPSRDID